MEFQFKEVTMKDETRFYRLKQFVNHKLLKNSCRIIDTMNMFYEIDWQLF